MVFNYRPFDDFKQWVVGAKVEGINGYGHRVNYVPYHLLEEYWQDDDRIDAVLTAVDQSIFVDRSDIFQRFLRIFSILVYISTPIAWQMHYITSFCSNNTDDHILPFSAPPEAFRPSIDNVSEDFLKCQYLFTAMAFGPTKMLMREVHAEVIWPLDFHKNICSRKNDGASLKSYTLHQSSGLSLPGNTIVMKEFPASELEFTFVKEASAYSQLRQTSGASSYFLECHGSFKQNGKGYIILEHADQGSLLDFYKRNDLPVDKAHYESFWRNFANLFMGVAMLHHIGKRPGAVSFRCIHQDLKPANIFVFKGPDEHAYDYRFKIGDLGLSSLDLVGIQDEDRLALDNQSTKMYGAPELTSHHNQLAILPQGVTFEVDVWSLGCLTAESLVWTVSGERGREQFLELRKAQTRRIPNHDAQGYGGCFHDGVARLSAVDDMLRIAIDNSRKFDWLTERVSKFVLERVLLQQWRRIPVQILHSQFGDLLKAADQHHRGSEMTGSEIAALPVNLNARESPQSRTWMAAHVETNSALEVPTLSSLPARSPPGGLLPSPNRPGVQPVVATQPEVSAYNFPYPSSPVSKHAGRPMRASVPAPSTGTNTAGGFPRHSYSDPRHARAVASTQSSMRIQDPTKPVHGIYARSSHPVNGLCAGIPIREQYSFPDLTDTPLQSHDEDELYDQLGVHNPETPDRNGSRRRRGKQPETPANVNSNRGAPNVKSTEYARITIEQVNEWITEKKDADRLRRRPPPPLQDQARVLSQLQGREQIFVVDDSRSMRKLHWNEVVPTVRALSYLVKDADPNGIELFLTSRPTKPEKALHGVTSSLVDFLKSFKESDTQPICNMENSLGDILNPVKDRLAPSRFRLSSRTPKTSIYILTDALWELTDRVKCGVENPIISLIDKMKKHNIMRTDVSIQFIRFGDDALSKKRLKYLDNGLAKDHGFDIVDRRSWHSSVWLMLLSSISKASDSDSDDSPDELEDVREDDWQEKEAEG